MFWRSRLRTRTIAIRENYCHLNKMTFDTHWTLIWDKKGDYWKEQFGMFTPVKLADGREVWSVGDVVIVNGKRPLDDRHLHAGVQSGLPCEHVQPRDAGNRHARRQHRIEKWGLSGSSGTIMMYSVTVLLRRCSWRSSSGAFLFPVREPRGKCSIVGARAGLA